MKFAVTKHIEIENPILEVYANVRYWEDGIVNGAEDTEGSNIPFRIGNLWAPKIDVNLGIVLNWPEGVTADVHYKVCDDGEYYIKDRCRIKLKYLGPYVPDEFLCHGQTGYGDCIILKIDGNGKIANYTPPDPDKLSGWGIFVKDVK